MTPPVALPPDAAALLEQVARAIADLDPACRTDTVPCGYQSCGCWRLARAALAEPPAAQAGEEG